jgi:hypothetical protein
MKFEVFRLSVTGTCVRTLATLAAETAGAGAVVRGVLMRAPAELSPSTGMEGEVRALEVFMELARLVMVKEASWIDRERLDWIKSLALIPGERE